MSNSLIVQQASKLASLFSIPESEELISVLKATAFKGNVSDAQMSALLIVANQYGLNPWTKEIFAFPDRGGIVPVVGVDGWSRIINSHPQFDGMSFEQDAESCTCIIHRKDRNHPTSATEYMSECSRATDPWKSHPKRMLRHKSLIQAARLAFGYTGIYDQDEAERIVNVNAAPTRKPDQPKEEIIIDVELRESLIKGLEQTAKLGTEPFKTAWKAMSQDNKALVGIPERDRIKAIADGIIIVPIDEFVSEIEEAEVQS